MRPREWEDAAAVHSVAVPKCRQSGRHPSITAIPVASCRWRRFALSGPNASLGASPGHMKCSVEVAQVSFPPSVTEEAEVQREVS